MSSVQYETLELHFPLLQNSLSKVIRSSCSLHFLSVNLRTPDDGLIAEDFLDFAILSDLPVI